MKRKRRLHSLYFPQNSLTLTESSGEFSDLHTMFRLHALRYGSKYYFILSIWSLVLFLLLLLTTEHWNIDDLAVEVYIFPSLNQKHNNNLYFGVKVFSPRGLTGDTKQ